MRIKRSRFPRMLFLPAGFAALFRERRNRGVALMRRCSLMLMLPLAQENIITKAELGGGERRRRMEMRDSGGVGSGSRGLGAPWKRARAHARGAERPQWLS